MEFLPLVVEGIENKIKKLVVRNRQLHQENRDLQRKLDQLGVENQTLRGEVQNLEEAIVKLKVSKSLSNGDQNQARLKIEELLREIDKCYTLLNR